MQYFDDTYLNRTVSKYPRSAVGGRMPWFGVNHETASPNSSNPHGTLIYNLTGDRGSYNYLIPRTGFPIFRYVDPEKYISYHAGVRSQWKHVAGWFVNVDSIGVEYDGPNDGTPITAAQVEAGKWLTQYLWDTFGIPCSHHFWPEHATVAPGYKTDSRGMDSATLVNPLGLKFISPPRITSGKFLELLHEWQSPILGEAAECWQELVSVGIDPAIALAFTRHEHKAGTDQNSLIVQHDLKNWGSVRTPMTAGVGVVQDFGKYGTFVKYASWRDSVREWGKRILEKYIRDLGLYTVDLAIPTYAPASDNNNEVAYIRSVRRNVEKWQAESVTLYGQIPTVSGQEADVPLFIHKYWEKSGGVWQPDRYALGLLKAVEDNTYSFERGRLREIDGVINALLEGED